MRYREKKSSETSRLPSPLFIHQSLHSIQCRVARPSTPLAYTEHPTRQTCGARDDLLDHFYLHARHTNRHVDRDHQPAHTDTHRDVPGACTQIPPVQKAPHIYKPLVDILIPIPRRKPSLPVPSSPPPRPRSTVWGACEQQRTLASAQRRVLRRHSHLTCPPPWCRRAPRLPGFGV